MRISELKSALQCNNCLNAKVRDDCLVCLVTQRQKSNNDCCDDGIWVAEFLDDEKLMSIIDLSYLTKEKAGKIKCVYQEDLSKHRKN